MFLKDTALLMIMQMAPCVLLLEEGYTHFAVICNFTYINHLHKFSPDESPERNLITYYK